jgi:hydroxyethylthiazole kinase-like uncharacterized protein yjeF
MMEPREIDHALLHRRRLPQPGNAGKDERGRLLILAGSAELPGAPLLVGDAALRAGAGKLMIAAPSDSVMALGMALAEARIAALPAKPTRRLFEDRDAVLIGPGMTNREATRWADAALGWAATAPTIFDAAALDGLWDSERLRTRRRAGGAPCIVTPHAGELAGMAGFDKQAILTEPRTPAVEAAAHLGAIVVLKAGATTIVATADSELFEFRARIPGLAMSGSGDVLAGLIGGLLARGTPALDACLWGVFLHAQAAKELAARHGSIGYRPGELAAQVPRLMDSMR